jgi:hypothetical protein
VHAQLVVLLALRHCTLHQPSQHLRFTPPAHASSIRPLLPTLTYHHFYTLTLTTGMSSSTTSSSHYYVALPADSTTSTASASTTAAASAAFPSSSSPPPRVVRTKRRCLGLSSGCLLLLLLGLLLFFLVPRRPIVRYQSSTLSLDEGTSSVTLTQLFSYYNPNYYTVYVLLSLSFALCLPSSLPPSMHDFRPSILSCAEAEVELSNATF